MTIAELSEDTGKLMAAIGRRARDTARGLALAASADKNAALKSMADALRRQRSTIAAANARDLAMAESHGRSAAFLDRLALTPARIEAMAQSLEVIAALPDPVGRISAQWVRPNGLEISRVTVPIGVIGIIFESRPNVTADAAGLSVKAGNAAILRSGSDSLQSADAIAACLGDGLHRAGLPVDAVQLVPVADRMAVGLMLGGLDGAIDVIVPRGGRSLVGRVQAEARVPVLAHLEGICHVYVDGSADLAMARAVTVNAKMRRTGVCGAAETVLIDRSGGTALVAAVAGALIDAGCEVRGDSDVQAVDWRVAPAQESDFGREFLDAVIALKVVDGVEEAIRHIRAYGSQHTDAIIAENSATAERFLREVDSAIVLHNASTQFADGGEFGFGAEIGIATGKLHARGPVGLEQLTTFKYQIRGAGQLRP
ncbi:MAG: glutamate-5-semialdehyde dehydrogenase [Aestuariivirgaceae bacterium]